MDEDLPPWMRRGFSEPRLRAYLEAAHGNPSTAMALYWWNIEVSAAFYGPLHCLEVMLRNALHDRLRGAYGRADWWASAPINDNAKGKVRAAHSKCVRRDGRTQPVTADDIVAELSFGFWVSLLSRGSAYDRRLWVPTLHRAFPEYHGRRDALYDSLWSLVLLRNRIGHHEPIHHRDLAADHAKIYRMIGYIDTESMNQLRAFDRVPTVLGSRELTCSGTRPPCF